MATDNRGTPVDLQALFATPVAIAQFPAAGQINPPLRALILEREQQQPTSDHSNRGGWQSSWDFADWCGEPGRRLLSFGEALAGKLTRHRSGRAIDLSWKVNAWANVNRGGHGNEFHTHPGALWSAVYYVDDGGAADNPALGGQLEMQDPRGVAPAMYRPDLVPAVPGGESIGASQLLPPRTGQVVMFPSWISHCVRPYNGDGIRISIAFNFSV